jgi:hypothetical protein
MIHLIIDKLCCQKQYCRVLQSGNKLDTETPVFLRFLSPWLDTCIYEAIPTVAVNLSDLCRRAKYEHSSGRAPSFRHPIYFPSPCLLPHTFLRENVKSKYLALLSQIYISLHRINVCCKLNRRHYEYIHTIPYSVLSIAVIFVACCIFSETCWETVYYFLKTYGFS